MKCCLVLIQEILNITGAIHNSVMTLDEYICNKILDLWKIKLLWLNKAKLLFFFSPVYKHETPSTVSQ